jgi:hypothetical protein
MLMKIVSCTAYLLLFGVIAFVNYKILTPALDSGIRIWLAPLSALFTSVGLASFWGLARGFGRGDRSRAALLQRARSGEIPADGHTIIATGIVQPLSKPLTSPLSATQCAMYMYRMYYVTVDSRNHRLETPVYWGYASRPFALDSSVRYRIFAVPRLSCDAQVFTGDDVLTRARSFLGVGHFEEASPGMIGSLESVFQMTQDVLDDENAEARRNWNRGPESRDPGDLILEETVLPIGVEASAIGTWSAEKGAIIGTKSNAVAVSLGPPENLSTKEGVPASTGAYFISALLLTAIGLGMLWFAIKILPTLK